MKPYNSQLLYSKKIKVLMPFFSIIAFLILIEISMRIVGMYANIDFRLYFKELVNSDRLPRDLFISNNQLGSQLAPNQQALATTSDFSVIYSVNSKGCRASEYNYQRSPGKVRILMLGDSLTFGEGIEKGERFSERFERQILNAEVINCGVPDYGIDQVLMYYLTEGYKYSADYVFLILHHWMNLRRRITIMENNKLINTKMQDNSLMKIPRPPRYTKPTSIIHNSYFISYIYYHIKRYLIKTHLEDYDHSHWNKIFSTHEKISLVNQTNRTLILVKLFITEVKKQNSIPVIINILPIAIPYMKNIYKDYYDFYNIMQSASTKAPLFFKYDPHPNSFANSIIADELTNLYMKLSKEPENSTNR